ncbi:MAG: methyltransferase domain-containing protein [Pelagibacterales bacterium]|nr:methyltransferase domain-containing protein [Pelagibacterales bacterium]
MIKKFLDLGMQPLANKYLTKKDIIKKNKELFYHLEVGFNSKTKLVSILNTVPSKKMFDDNYPYRSSMSQTMILSFKKLAKNLINTYNPNSILEIGSNDGSLIRNFSKKKVICVEPCKNLAKITKRMGYKTYANFWNMKLAKKIKSKIKNVDLIYSGNTLSHINDLNSVFKSIVHVLSDDGILIIEDPSLLKCLQNVSYDQFYNEHIYVFSLLSISNLIKKYKLEVFNIEKLNTHGGSLRYYIKKVLNKKFDVNKKVTMQLNQELNYGINKYATYIEFKNKVESSKKKLKQIFLKLKKKNKKIIGYGATAKSSTVLNYCNIKNKTLEYFLDTTPNKTGKYMPGTHIYIQSYSKHLLNRADYAFLGAWNFKEEIFKKERRYIKNGGKFITHIPIPRIV